MLRWLLIGLILAGNQTLGAAITTADDLKRRLPEIYDDPKSFRLELEQTLTRVDQEKDPEFWTKLHAHAAEAAWFQEETDIARAHVQAALPLAEAKGYIKPLALLTYVKGGLLEYDAKVEEAEIYFLKAIEFARSSGDPELLANISTVTGSYFHRSGKSDRAALVFKEVFQLLPQLPTDAIYFDMLSSIGALYGQSMGPRREEGFRMMSDALNFAREHKLRYLAYWVSQAMIDSYKELQQFDKVEEALTENLRIAQSLGYENYIAGTHLERGRFRYERKRFEEALGDLEFARNFYKNRGISFYDISILSDLGMVYVVLKKYEKIPKLLQDFSGALKEDSSLGQKVQVNVMLQRYYRATDQNDKELIVLRDLLIFISEFAELKRSEELGRLTRDLEVQRQQFLNEKLTSQNRLQTEEIQRQERTQHLMFGVLGLGALALGASGIALRRGREIKLQRTNLKMILDHIEEGILRFGADLLIQGEYSRYSGELLSCRDSLRGHSIWDLLFAQATSPVSDPEVWRETLRAVFGENRLSWDLNEGNLPREIHLRERILALDWQALPDAEGLTQTVLLLIRDITEQMAARKKVEVAQERISRMSERIEAIARGRPQRIAQFLREAEKTIEPLQKSISMQEQYSDIKRMLHTLKGAARTLGLKDISMIVHGFEDLFMARELNHASYEQYMQNLIESLNAYRELLPHLNLVQNQAVENLWDMASKFLPEAQQRLATRFPMVARFQVIDQFLQWKKMNRSEIQDMLLHAITNSIDHGFLLPHARGERMEGVPMLTLEASADDEHLILQLSDNGFGINWSKLEVLAQERNFHPEHGRELTDLLFLEGTSTASQISTTSGRGMGLAAIHSIARGLGGDVSLSNNPQGRGACLTITLPL